MTLIAKNFESSNLDGITVTVAERVYSNQDILNVLQKVGFSLSRNLFLVLIVWVE